MPVFEKSKSKLKMVILTKRKEDNAVQYSPIKQNKWKNEKIIAGMLERFKSNKLFPVTNVIQFYENNVLVAKISIKT